MKITRILLVMAAGTILASCASIFSKSKILLTNDNVNEPVNITTDKAHYENVFLPAKVKIKKGYGTSSIMVTSRNYQPLNLIVDKKFNAAYIANVFFPIGFIIDAATGAIMKPAKKAYYLNLKPKNENNQNIRSCLKFFLRKFETCFRADFCRFLRRIAALFYDKNGGKMPEWGHKELLKNF